MKIDRKSFPVARRIQKRGQLKKAHYTSAGGAHLMQLESRLEASGATAIGLDPRVRSIRSQPMTFDLLTGRTYATVDALNEAQKLYGLRCKKYTPDFEVDLGASKVLVEIKHRELINLDPEILRYPGILARYGYRLVVLDDEVLAETYVRNLRLLNSAKSVRISGERSVDIIAACGEGTAYGHLVSRGFDERLVLSSIALGHLTFDIKAARLSYSTIISASGDTARHLKELPLVSIDH